MPTPRSRRPPQAPFAARIHSRPPAPLQTSTDELGTYSEGELLDDPDAFEDALSAIEPLSDKCLKAISNLAKYKPPPDPYPFPEGRSAVLVVLFGSRSGENLNVLLSTRSQTLRTYPGQVALPGGKMDDTDINLEATARREAFEEIGLPIDTTRIRYLTTLPPFLARSMMLVTPVVCLNLDYSLRPELSHAEVADLFSFPLEGFLTSDAHAPLFHRPPPARVQRGEVPYLTTEDYPWFDGKKHRYHAFEADPQPITGLTAEILIHVAMVAYNRPPDFKLRAPNQMTMRGLILRAMRDPRWHDFRETWRKKKSAPTDQTEVGRVAMEVKGKL